MKNIHLHVTLAVGDAIKTLGEVPSGHLYAHLMSRMSVEDYETIIGELIAVKCVRRRNHLLTWIGKP